MPIRPRFLGALALSALLVPGLIARAHAAEIRPVATEACDILLEGDILPGDSDAFAEAIRRMPERRQGGRTLCLNSTGGWLSETIAIAELIADHGLATHVPAGAQCLSACALAFMFGNTFSEEGSTLPKRQLHYTARLGFHRPRLELAPGKQYTSEETALYFNMAFEALLKMFDISQRHATYRGPALPWSLFSEMLHYREPYSFVYVDTAYKAILWDIEITGFDYPRAMSENAFVNACATAETIVLHGSQPFTEYRVDRGLGGFPISDIAVDGTDVRMSTAGGWLGEGAWPCEIWHIDFHGIAHAPSSGFTRLCFGDTRTSTGSCFEAPLLGFPPDTALIDLPTVARRLDAEGRAYLAAQAR